MSNPRLVELRTLTGRIVVETGLRTGGSQETMEISGLDNPIIRNPANAEPFKGKYRSSSTRVRLASLISSLALPSQSRTYLGPL